VGYARIRCDQGGIEPRSGSQTPLDGPVVVLEEGGDQSQATHAISGLTRGPTEHRCVRLTDGLSGRGGTGETHSMFAPLLAKRASFRAAEPLFAGAGVGRRFSMWVAPLYSSHLPINHIDNHFGLFRQGSIPTINTRGRSTAQSGSKLPLSRSPMYISIVSSPAANRTVDRFKPSSSIWSNG